MFMQSDDPLDDFTALGFKLTRAVDALDDPKEKASGSDAASLARTRRMLGEKLKIDRLAELESDYGLLGDALSLSSGSGAAAVANERRMIRKLLDQLATNAEEVPVVDQLASNVVALAPRRDARAARSSA